MQVPKRVLVGFAIVCLTVVGAIVIVVWPTGEAILREMAREGDSITLRESADTLLWMVGGLMVAAALGLGAMYLALRRLLGLDRGWLRNAIPMSATVVEVRDGSPAAKVIDRAVGPAVQVRFSGSDAAEGVAQAQTRAGAPQQGRKVDVQIDPADLARAAIESALGRDGRASGLAGMIARLVGRSMLPRGMLPLVTLRRNVQVPGLTGTIALSDPKAAEETIAKGERGEGTIQAVSDAAAMSELMARELEADPAKSEDALLFVSMQVRPRNGGEPFEAQGIHRVPKRRVSTLAIGRSVAVAYMPGRPETVTIDWTRS